MVIRPFRLSTLATLAVTALTLAACAADSEPETGSDRPPPPVQTPDDETEPPAAGDAPVPETLDFTVPTVDGGSFDGASLVGTASVLWFWAPWCSICAGQAPHVNELAEEFHGRADVVGVAGLDQNLDAMRQFIDRHGLDGFPHLADPDGVVWQRFETTQQSTFVVLDAQGEVVAKGAMDAGDDLPARLGELVG